MKGFMETESKEPSDKNNLAQSFWVTKDEWNHQPENVAIKAGVATAVILAAGQFAPLIAVGAALVVIGRLIRL